MFESMVSFPQAPFTSRSRFMQPTHLLSPRQKQTRITKSRQHDVKAISDQTQIENFLNVVSEQNLAEVQRIKV